MNSKAISQDWIDTDLYPFKHNYMELPEGRMHYVDEGEGEVILFIHGTPTWSFLYRDFIKELSKTNRCIAIDHLGFGLSEAQESFSGTPQDHSKNLSRFIEKLDLTDITLVVHDFGGPIGLGAAINDPERVKNIVLFNSWMWETRNNESAQKIDKIINGWMGRTLYLNFNFSPKVLLKKGFADKKNLSKQVHKHYTNPFPNKESRMPLLYIAKALVGSSDWYQNLWLQMDKLEGKQWMILWGSKDEFITTEYLEKWKGRLPNAVVKEFPSGHFVQVEQTLQAIDEIQQFVK